MFYHYYYVLTHLMPPQKAHTVPGEGNISEQKHHESQAYYLPFYGSIYR